MAGYTIRNLLAVEDSAPKFGLAPALEVRFAREDLELERSGLSFQRLQPGARVPFGHKHREQEELYVVVGGSGRMKLDDEIVELGRWDVVRVSPETMRCFEAGDEGIEVLVLGAPNTGGGDVEMAPGWWDD